MGIVHLSIQDCPYFIELAGSFRYHRLLPKTGGYPT
ncbi:hypothetical protein EVA_00419, partial [gut metagenome]